MAVINIPPDPTQPGRASVLIDVGRADIQTTIALLQQAKQLLERDGLPGGTQRTFSRAQQANGTYQPEAVNGVQHITDPPASRQPGPAQPQTQSNAPVPVKMAHLFPKENTDATGTTAPASSLSDAQHAGPLPTHSIQTEQQHTEPAQHINDASHQQHTEQQSSAQVASSREPTGWVSPQQHAQQESQQQPQQHPQQQPEDYWQDNRISYGQTAGSEDAWIGKSGKRAGKQLLATKGTRPITINHMSWEAPQEAPAPMEEEPVAQPQPGKGRPRQSKLGPKPTPRGPQRQLSSDSEGPPPALPQPGSAFPQPGSAFAQPGNALPQPGNMFPQPGGIPPHLPAVASRSALPGPAPAMSNASSMSSPSYSQSNAQQPRHHAQIDTSVNWQRMWTTEAADHGGDVVTACLHLASMTDLPDNGEHAGYLVSSSCNLLNLWQCSCSMEEPALQLVHCLDTDFQAADLQLDPANQALLAAAKDTRATTECVAVHHLRLASGIFRLHGRLGLPVGVTGPRAKNPNAPLAMQVQSVHHYGGTLTGCCAASCGGQIAIYPSKVVPGELAKAKGAWNAHSSTITSLHAGAFQPHLLSGDAAGFIHGWNLRTKPSQPIYQMKHKSAVTGLVAIDDFSLVSCCTDSRIALWDIRNNSKPVKYMSAPDGRPVLKMSAQLATKNIAFSTPSGIYAVNLDRFGKVQHVSTQDAGQTLALSWNIGNTGQTYLYTANGATISAYRASQ